MRGSSIVLLSSVAGLTGQPAISVYSASKAALIGFGRAAAVELAAEGIRAELRRTRIRRDGNGGGPSREADAGTV